MKKNERDIWGAAYQILQEWCKGQQNKHEAYEKLSEALKICGFDMIATESKNLVEKPASSSADDDDY